MSDKWIDLEGKVIVVTGGAMGIGEAIVNDLKNCGAYVAIFDRCEPKDYKEEETIGARNKCNCFESFGGDRKYCTERRKCLGSQTSSRRLSRNSAE